MPLKMIYPDTPPREYEHLRCLVVPSGIGEFQWLMAKVNNCGEKLAVFGLDGAPQRLHQFVELHPNVEAFGYVGYDYSQIREYQKHFELYTWAKVREQFGMGQKVMLACNPHLEAGKLLKDWMHDLDTTYTYPIVTTTEHVLEATNALAGMHTTFEHGDQVKLIGISCASYRGANAWRTWHSKEWIAFLQKVQLLDSRIRFVLLGGSWDDLTASIFDREDTGISWETNSRGLPPVGRTSFGGAVEILKRLDGYIGFSSGLGHVAAHLCGTPVFMLWPEHEQALSRTWCNPEILETGTYVPSRWLSVDEVYASAKPWLSSHVLK